MNGCKKGWETEKKGSALNSDFFSREACHGIYGQEDWARSGELRWSRLPHLLMAAPSTDVGLDVSSFEF